MGSVPMFPLCFITLVPNGLAMRFTEGAPRPIQVMREQMQREQVKRETHR